MVMDAPPPSNGGPYMMPMQHPHAMPYGQPGYYPPNISPQGPPPNGQQTGNPTDFSEYLWMENEEDFDKEVNTVFTFFYSVAVLLLSYFSSRNMSLLTCYF
jgi:hypothetical protein